MNFIEILKNALSKIDSVYYSSERFYEYNQCHLYFNRLKGSNHPFKYWERVFCYELYHQLRKILELNPNLSKNIKLQCELTKYELMELGEQYFEVKNLDKEYIPDFLLHSFDNSFNQIAIMEVKAKPALNFSDYKNDLSKISQFIIRLKFKHGLLLVINNDFSRLEKQIKINKVKICEIVNADFENIIIVCKENSDPTIVPIVKSLSEILEIN